MVGQLPFDASDLHVVDAVVVEHFLGDLRSGKSAGREHFREFGEHAFQFPLYQHSNHADDNDENPICIHDFRILCLSCKDNGKIQYVE